MKTMRVVGLMVILTLVGAVAALAADEERLGSDVADAIQTFRAADLRADTLFNTAYGYAVFPSVDKGAAGIGVAEGKGLVYEDGALVGRAKLSQVTVGAQLGGQSYSEVIFFQTQKALDEFKDGKTAISAGVSAVAAAEGASAEAKYQDGVEVYTITKAGLMFEASIGGQHFKFRPVYTGSPAPTATQAAPAGTAIPPLAPPSEMPAQ